MSRDHFEGHDLSKLSDVGFFCNDESAWFKNVFALTSGIYVNQSVVLLTVIVRVGGRCIDKLKC